MMNMCVCVYIYMYNYIPNAVKEMSSDYYKSILYLYLVYESLLKYIKKNSLALACTLNQSSNSQQ